MKKVKKYLSKKEYIIFALSLVIILLSTFSYAFFYNVENTQENIVTSECFKLSFEDQDDININSAYPISDSEGSNLKPYQFTIRNVCKRAGNYQINIETLNNSTLSTNYLKYKLDNQTPSILGNQLEVQEYINNNVSESRNIEVGLILPNEEVTYSLRLWIDEKSTYEQTSEKEYTGKVVVKTVENKEPYQTITLNTNGGEITNNEVIKIKTRSIGDIPSPTRLGYTFDGWYKDQELENKITGSEIVTNEITNLYAKWIPITYTITYEYLLDGVNPNTINEYTIESENIVFENPTKEGYIGSWNIPIIEKGSTGNKIITANWEKRTYTITYNYRNNVYNSDTNTYSFHGNSKVNNSYSYNGSTGYEVYSNQNRYTGMRIPTNNDKKINTNYIISVQAYRTIDFTDSLRVYVPTFDSNNQLITYHHYINISNSNLPLRTWKQFSGTFNSGNYSTLPHIYIDFSYANQGPVYLSDLRFDEYVTQGKQYESTLGTLPNPVRTGYKFLGWFTDPSGGTQINENTIVNRDVTYYAHWSVPTFKITTWQRPAEQNVSTSLITIGNTTYTSVGGTTSSSLANYWYERSYTTNVLGGTQITITSSYGASTKWYNSANESGYVCTGSKLTGIAPSADSSIWVVPDVGGHDNAKRRVISSLTNLKCS